MKLIEINLSEVTLDKVKSLCISLSERYDGCTIYKTIGYRSEGSYLFEEPSEDIKKEQGYGLKVLTEEEDLNRIEKILRTQLKGTQIKWVQVVSYEITTNHLEMV